MTLVLLRARRKWSKNRLSLVLSRNKGEEVALSGVQRAGKGAAPIASTLTVKWLGGAKLLEVLDCLAVAGGEVVKGRVIRQGNSGGAGRGKMSWGRGSRRDGQGIGVLPNVR